MKMKSDNTRPTLRGKKSERNFAYASVKPKVYIIHVTHDTIQATHYTDRKVICSTNEPKCAICVRSPSLYSTPELDAALNGNK